MISYETIGKLCDLLEADAANAAGIKAVQEAVKQKKGGPSVIAKGIFDLAAESKDINVTALLLQY